MNHEDECVIMALSFQDEVRMKTLIVALNSKYIHTSLAPWYLKASCGPECGLVKVREFTINDSPDAVLAAIYEEEACCVAFSCYIWNLEFVRKLAASLKKILPEALIVYGGPEVSFLSAEELSSFHEVDYILPGEGEVSFPKLLRRINGNMGEKACMGSDEELSSRNILGNTGAVVLPPEPLVEELDSLPSPYTQEMLSSIGRHRIAYFESSRGCPFSCSYCLSSTFEGVRFFSLDRVKEDLSRLVGAGAGQIKFTDRTFNCHKERARSIFRHIIKEYGHLPNLNFHFEAAGDLFDRDTLEVLADAPEGLIQFEIGVQSTHLETLKAINRKTDLRRVFEHVRAIRERGNIHLHLDLIAGLPFEDYRTFRRSFDEVYSMKPHQLQLGFLKLLKGSSIRREATRLGYEFHGHPPYEVLRSDWIRYEELLELKRIEELVDRFYNTGRFVKTLEFLIKNHSKNYGSIQYFAFDFYHRFACFCRDRGLLDNPPSSRELYGILSDFASGFLTAEQYRICHELLKLDFLSSHNTGSLPDGLSRTEDEGFRNRCFEFLKNEDNVSSFLPEMVGMPAKQIFKRVHFENFLLDVTAPDPENVLMQPATVLFNYGSRNRVTGLFAYRKINRFDLIKN